MQAALLSAYDIHHRALRRPFDHSPNWDVVFIDSGGYELSPEFDSTEPKPVSSAPREFCQDDYAAVLGSLPAGLRCVICNYDHAARGRPLDVQSQTAKQLFSGHTGFASDFLVHPESRRRKYLSPEAIVDRPDLLRGFDLVGFTEKELGKNLMDRLKVVAQLRRTLETAGVRAPIHIWGGLDPVVSPLYFFAGADVFDGLSWLRYGYHFGVSVQSESYVVLKSEYGITTPADHAWVLRLNANISALTNLQTAMRRFADSNGTAFSVFGPQETPLRQAYEVMCTMIPELREG